MSTENADINKAAYDLVAANYSKEHDEELVWQPELDKFISYLRAPQFVADLGCGHGTETTYLAKRLPGTEVDGIDFSSRMIAIAKASDTSAHFDALDLTDYVPAQPLDGVWARASLHHLSDVQLLQTLDHIMSAAGPDFVVGMVNKYGSTEETEEKQKYGHALKRYFNYFDESKVAQISEKFGLTLLEQYMKPEGEHNFLVTFLNRSRLSPSS